MISGDDEKLLSSASLLSVAKELTTEKVSDDETKKKRRKKEEEPLEDGDDEDSNSSTSSSSSSASSSRPNALDIENTGVAKSVDSQQPTTAQVTLKNMTNNQSELTESRSKQQQYSKLEQNEATDNSGSKHGSLKLVVNNNNNNNSTNVAKSNSLSKNKK